MTEPILLTHETSRVVGVSAHFAINLDQTLHNNFCDLTVGQGILEPVTQENH